MSEIRVKYDDMLAAIRFMLLPQAEKSRIAQEHVGDATAPPWLDDHVFMGLQQAGWIEVIPITKEQLKHLGEGTSVASGSNGELGRVAVSAAGKEAIAKDDANNVIRKPS